jgi:hypothetical protein
MTEVLDTYAELVNEETGVWSEDGAGGDETEQLAPPTEVRTPAWSDDWSDEQREDQPVREGQSWKHVSLIAAAIFVPLTALVVIIGLWMQQPRKPPVPEPSRVPQTTTAVATPPVTVTAPPPVTVTQAAPPTVTVAPPPPVAAPPSHETFLICPDGHSGVATSVTSCQFAMNLRDSYLSDGGPVVSAYSPVTGDTYQMVCHSGLTARLSDGETVNAVRCTGGNDAVVILW